MSIRQMLAWADAFHRRTGRWPTHKSGVIPQSDGDTWYGMQSCLDKGCRGLPGGSSVARLLAEYRGKRNLKALPRLTEKLILRWADSHYRRTGDWPTIKSGKVAEAAGEEWYNLNAALGQGCRGLPGGNTLRQLLAKYRGVRNRKRLPRLRIAQVLAWADAFHKQTGQWPTKKSGPIRESKGETWSAVDAALHNACRGFPGGSSLARVLDVHRGVRNRKDLPPLRPRTILRWMEAHHSQTGRWPYDKSRAVSAAPGETWAGVEAALRVGLRGLPGGSSLYRLRRRYGRI